MKSFFITLIVFSTITSASLAVPFTLLTGVYRYTKLANSTVSIEGGSLYSSGTYTASFTFNYPAAELATRGLDATTLNTISGKFVTGADYINSELATVEGRDRLSNYSFSAAVYPTDQGNVYIVTAGGFTPKVPTINVSVTRTTIQEGGQRSAIVLNLNRAAADELIVRYTLDGTAKLKDDYTGPAATRTLEIPKGITTIHIPVRPVDDQAKELAETLIFQLAKNDGYRMGSVKTATIRINDND